MTDEMPDFEFASAIARINDTDDVRQLRTLQVLLKHRWPGAKETMTLTATIERKITRLINSN